MFYFYFIRDCQFRNGVGDDLLISALGVSPLSLLFNKLNACSTGLELVKIKLLKMFTLIIFTVFLTDSDKKENKKQITSFNCHTLSCFTGVKDTDAGIRAIFLYWNNEHTMKRKNNNDQHAQHGSAPNNQINKRNSKEVKTDCWLWK